MTTWGDFKAGLIDALDDTNRDQPTWSDAMLLRYMNYALLSISEHTAQTKEWTYTPTAPVRTIDLPDDVMELGPIYVVYNVLKVLLTPRRRQPGESWYTIHATILPQEFYEWPENKRINLFTDLRTNQQLVFNYWANSWGPLEKDADVLGVFPWMEKALEWNVLAQAMAKPGLQLAQLRSYNTKRDSGSPEDNPYIVQAEYYRKQYERVLANHEQQDRSGWETQ